MPEPLIYPMELASATNRPMIQFSSTYGTPAVTSYIYMPVPMNISFADGATYNDVELGFVGASIAKLGQDGAVGAAKAAVASMPKSLGNLAQGLAEISGAPTEIKAGVSIGVGATLNKNITTQFTGTATRQYQFEFKFIASTAAESKLIADILKTFRLGLYPKGTQYQLQYPPTWNIKFINGASDGREISFLPKIFPGCYLTTMTSTYNSVANMWRVDGSPLDTSMTLTFIESRALTQDDIQKLVVTSGRQETLAQDFVAAYNMPSNESDISNDSTASSSATQTLVQATLG